MVKQDFQPTYEERAGSLGGVDLSDELVRGGESPSFPPPSCPADYTIGLNKICMRSDVRARS